MSRSGHIGHETMCGVEMEKDFHSQREPQELLRASEIRYRRLFEAAHEGVLLLAREQAARRPSCIRKGIAP